MAPTDAERYSSEHPVRGNSKPACTLVSSDSLGGFTDKWPEDALELLAEVFDACIGGRTASPAARAWLAGGIAASIRRSEGLDASLGLAGPGLRTIQRQVLTLQRDMHLLEAIQAVSIDPKTSNWQRCKRLAPLVSQFLSGAWPNVRYLDVPPTEWPLWKFHLFQAARTDIELPCSTRGLYNIVQADARYSIHSRKAKLLAHLL